MKDLHPTKFERRQKLSFKELCDSQLFGLHAFDNLAISLSQQRGKTQKDRL